MALIPKLSSGALAGFAATFPMTLAMKVQHRFLPIEERRALPPKRITMRMARNIGAMLPTLIPKHRRIATAVSHFGFGAAAGSVYPLYPASLTGRRRIAGGILHGLLVYGGSYLGWLPATGLYKPRGGRKARLALLAVAHVVWGACLGALYRPINDRVTRV